MRKARQKIFVGISGGVDSSVAAYLLKKQGHEVHGVFVKTWSPEWLPCTWIDEKRDAMRVCATLGIPFHFLDAEEEYKKGVADYMIAEYRAGRTPNPDVLCNRVIKFGILWEYAQSLGANAIATGHYAQVRSSPILGTMGMLKKGADASKDQSYFLWMLQSSELVHIRFPIGHLRKSEVRAVAERAGLLTAEKKDSQGICFLGDIDMREFLSRYIEQKEGIVKNERGEVIGQHDGVWFYTLGERHGFRIVEKNARRIPQYVIRKNIEKNELVVASSPIVMRSEDARKESKVTVLLREINWLAPFQKGKIYDAQIRYHGMLIPAVVEDKDAVLLVYDGIVPLGQSLVIYDGDVLIGGGIIDAVTDK